MVKEPWKVFEIQGDGLVFHLDRFNEVVGKIPADMPIMIISIIGTKRLGKSYVLNRLLAHFNKPLGDSQSTVKTSASHKDTFFDSKEGVDPVTTGIDIWSEPIILQNDSGTQIAVLVLDCQGEYDKKTDSTGNAVILTITHLLSSFLIFNMQSQIDENILQKFVGLSEYLKEIQQMAPEIAHSNPTLLFLIRDFQFEDPYGLGLSKRRENNDSKETYYDSVFNVDNVPQENRAAREAVRSIFKSNVMFTLPHPGRNFVKSGKGPDVDFEEHITKLINYISNIMESKKVGSEDLTKDYLAEILMNLNELCLTGKFPRAETLGQMYIKLDEERRRLKKFKRATAFAVLGAAAVGGASLVAVYKGSTAAKGAAAVLRWKAAGAGTAGFISGGIGGFVTTK